MKKMPIMFAGLLILTLFAGRGFSVDIDTTITYQGRLSDGGSPADGPYDLQFTLFDADTGGKVIGLVVSVDDKPVADGLFAVELDFENPADPNAFNGEGRWIEIAVRPFDSVGAYTTLSPRQKLTAAPFALHTKGVLIDQIQDNTSVGEAAGVSHTTGSFNTALGVAALYGNTTGNYNSSVGHWALNHNTDGDNNTAMGHGALSLNHSGNNNTGFGFDANRMNFLGSDNTIIGYQAGRGTNIHNKSGNVFLGFKAGYNETGSNKLYIANSDTTAPLIGGDFAARAVTVDGRIDSSGSNGGLFSAYNPNNQSASVNLSWLNDIARIRVGGTGTGAQNGFDFQTTGDASIMRLLHNGNVGIGATTPTDDLHIKRLGSVSILLEADTNDSGESDQPSITMTQDDTLIAAKLGFFDQQNDFSIHTGGTTVSSTPNILLLPKGNVGVGTTSPSNPLTVDTGGTDTGGVAGFPEVTTRIKNISANHSALSIDTASNKDAILYLAEDGAAQWGVRHDASSGDFQVRHHASGGNTLMSIDSAGELSVNSGKISGLLTVSSGRIYSSDSQWNTGVGGNTLTQNTTGSKNTAIGHSALTQNTTGHYNSAMGFSALDSNTTGIYNTAVGAYALESNTIGEYNTAVGYSAQCPSEGAFNTAIGCFANRYQSEGSRNTTIGHAAGGFDHYDFDERNRSGCVFIGYMAGYSEREDDKLYIDNSDTSTPLIHGDFAANRVGINWIATANALEVGGAASKTTAGSWLANSDARIKTDIHTIGNALDTLDKVNLVSFKYSKDYQESHPGIDQRSYINVIAQEFMEVFPEYVKSSKEKLPNGQEILQVDTYPLTIYSAAAVQELHLKIKTQSDQITELKANMAKMQVMLETLVAKKAGN